MIKKQTILTAGANDQGVKRGEGEVAPRIEEGVVHHQRSVAIVEDLERGPVSENADVPGHVHPQDADEADLEVTTDVNAGEADR